MTRTHSRPGVEELEGRTLPSVTILSPPALDGALAGQITPQAPGPMDAGTNYTLSGVGTLDGVGHATVEGILHTTGFLRNGHATGEVTLTDALGTVKLALQGPTQGAFAPLPDHFRFTVESGTGAYAHLSSSGDITFHMGAHHQFHLDIDPSLDGAVSGSFVRHGPEPVDAGVSYTLTGSGKLAGVGHVAVSGSVQAPGFLANGRATGELTLTSAGGSLTLDLQGPAQGFFAPLPDHFHFTVASGTGAYAHFQSSGDLTLHLDASHHTFRLDLEPTV